MKCARKWRCSAQPSAMPGIAIIPLIALLWQGCASTSTSSTAHNTLSKEEYTMTFSPSHPPAEARITFPLEQLQRLPEGAKITERQRHTTATVIRRADTLTFTARTDSLPATMVSHTSRKIQESVDRKETPRARSSFLLTLQLFFACSTLLLFVFLLIFFAFP